MSKKIWEKIKDFSQAIPMGRPLVNPPTPDDCTQDSKGKIKVGFQPPDEKPMNKAEATWKKVEKKMDSFFKWLDKITPKLLKAARRLVLGVLLWYVLGYFIPPLREALPDMFRFIDGTLWCLNEAWKWVFKSAEGLIKFFGG